MTIHLSARIAWHMDGWNGRICRNPSANTYCIGPHSYPGDAVKQKRDLEWETSVAGQCCSKLQGTPPCIASINAFGTERLKATAEVPEFFNSGETTSWDLPPASVSVWPYEAMYAGDVHTGGKYDYDKRLKNAQEFFQNIEAGKSLVVHYANYSNPFSGEDSKKYAVVGLSRVKRIGDPIYYEGTDAETKQKYGGGFVWQRNIETYYPDEGLRIPYHLYLDQPELLERLAFFPDNTRPFKYGSRHISDDEALSLVERFVEIVGYLVEIKDCSENWSQRLDWLNSLMAELWESRGLYPGLARVLDIIGLPSAITPLRKAMASGKEKEFHGAVFAFLHGASDTFPELLLCPSEVNKVRRNWKLRPSDVQRILSSTIPRFDLQKDQILKIIDGARANNGIIGSLSEIEENPYIICEQYVGDDPDDGIPFSRIDHGVYPSPDLGGDCFFDKDDYRRLRALLVDRLSYETKHTFLSTGRLLQDINLKLSYLPEWKRFQYTQQYIEVDREHLEPAIHFHKEGVQEYAYLRGVYEAEREIEGRIKTLAAYSDIKFKSPVTTQHWRDMLRDPSSTLVSKSPTEYKAAIESQAEVCAKIFTRPISVVCGAAGTGKTTIINAILRAIDKAHGHNATFLLLAPTGKAADRIREKTKKPAKTIHSFLAQLGWLNPNLTIRRTGGKKEDSITTFVVDEASMLNLELLATLFRAINWGAVQRLIIVGDPNQLPPIGRGKVFADIVDWLRENYPDSVGELNINLRQMENKATGTGTGILDLAALYTRDADHSGKDEEASLRAEEVFQRIQDLPPDGSYDKDLRLIFWKEPTDLLDRLVNRIIADMEADTGHQFDPEKPHQLWLQASKAAEGHYRPDYCQIISPYLHEEFGTEAINIRIQFEARGGSLTRVGSIAGITLFDKVIQIRNRGTSDPIYGYNYSSRQNEACEVYNGELGYVYPHGFDAKKWKGNHFRLKRFAVKFSRKEHIAVGYGAELGSVTKNGKQRFIRDEKPEDNLQLAYAISVHKSQGSEFDRVYFVLPKQKIALVSPELFYTGITRATKHCTIFIEEDVTPLLKIRRPEASHLVGINCSLFNFQPAPEGFETLRREGYYEEGKIHESLAEVMVRSKGEVIIANMLHDREIPFRYEVPLYAPDGTFYLPDFTITWRGETYFWEHLGLLHRDEYKRKWAIKKEWYEKHFPERLVVTEDSGFLSRHAKEVIDKHFS